WYDALEEVRLQRGDAAAARIVEQVVNRAREVGIAVPVALETPYVNTIDKAREPQYPGDLGVERRIRTLVRWNAMAMVVRANRDYPGIGGHISTFASAATLFE